MKSRFSCPCERLESLFNFIVFAHVRNENYSIILRSAGFRAKAAGQAMAGGGQKVRKH
ncbi:MAG: hypothetical protein NTY64_10015 [Deltaproteobacteria bacterium]|nr:hypothetical protein [Deltaproteobacteria bacterium]